MLLSGPGASCDSTQLRSGPGASCGSTQLRSGPDAVRLNLVQAREANQTAICCATAVLLLLFRSSSCSCSAGASALQVLLLLLLPLRSCSAGAAALHALQVLLLLLLRSCCAAPALVLRCCVYASAPAGALCQGLSARGRLGALRAAPGGQPFKRELASLRGAQGTALGGGTGRSRL